MISKEASMNILDKKETGSVLSEEHARLLEWYFGAGRATFGRSTCGAIIERLQMFSFGSEPCKACNGTGFRGGWSYGAESKAHTNAEELAMLLDVTPRKRAYGGDLDGCCDHCRGSGVHARTSRRRAKGPITARPVHGESRSGGGYLPTDFALQHYAIACRRLDIVNRAEPRAAIVLETFYGDWGGRWADTTQGRIFAVYCLTAAGHKLLRMSHDKARLEAHELPPHEVLGVEFELQRAQPSRQRGDLFTAAREQAVRALERASQVWNLSEPEAERWRRERRASRKKVRQDARIREILAQGAA